MGEPRIVVYGAGAVGGVVAARLRLAGVEVGVVARGPHLAAIRTDGLRLVTPDGEHVVRLPAADRLADLDPDDDTTVVVAVKSHQTASVLSDVARSTPPSVTLVSAQNGVANEATMLHTRSHVLGVCVMLPASHLEPGVVVQASRRAPGLLDVGCYPGGIDGRCERVAELLRAGGFESVARPDIMAWKHRKLLMNLGNAVQALCAPGPDRAGLGRLAREEGERVLAAAGVEVTPEEVDAARRGDLLDTSAAPARAGGSTWQSVRRRTGDVEVDYLNGEICALGRMHGVPTPVNELLRDTTWQLVAAGGDPGTLDAGELLAAAGRSARP